MKDKPHFCYNKYSMEWEVWPDRIQSLVCHPITSAKTIMECWDRYNRLMHGMTA